MRYTHLLTRIAATVAVLLALTTATERPPIMPAAHTAVLVEVHMYGVVRYEATWVILNNATHIPKGLAGVNCDATTGELVITFSTPLVAVGTASVSPDETYAGRYFLGPSVGLGAAYVTFRDRNGTTVHCANTVLRLNNSNAFFEARGYVAS